MQNQNPKIYTLQFWLLCFSSFLFFGSFNMIIPELPAYLTKLGGEDYKGYIISLFTLTAAISRPFSGKLTDKIGRIPVMVFGASICFALGFVYPFVTTITGFFILRLAHGFSTGFKPTGTVAYAADIVPSIRRGEAMGILGVFGTMGMALGPPLGSQLTLWFNIETMFMTSSVMAIMSIIILLGMTETLPNPERFKLSHLRITRRDIFEKTAIPPSIIMVMNVFSFGIVLTVIPDFSVHLCLENKGLYYLVFTGSSLAVRIFAGKASDKYGRVPILMVAAVLYIAGTLVTGFAESVNMFFAGALIYGLGVGMNSPTLFAWTADLCKDEDRGKAMATVFIALEIGIMSGAIISGYTFDNDPSNLPLTFALASVTAFIGLLYLIFYRKYRQL